MDNKIIITIVMLLAALIFISFGVIMYVSMYNIVGENSRYDCQVENDNIYSCVIKEATNNKINMEVNE